MALPVYKEGNLFLKWDSKVSYFGFSGRLTAMEICVKKVELGRRKSWAVM